MPDSNDNLRNRPEYRKAEDYLARIEEYLDRLEADPRIDIRDYAERAHYFLRVAKDCMKENARLVTVSRRESDPLYGLEWKDDSTGEDYAHPGMLVQVLVAMQAHLSDIDSEHLQSAIPSEQRQRGLGIRPFMSVHNRIKWLRIPERPSSGWLRKLLRMGDNYSTAQTDKGKKRAKQRRKAKEQRRTWADQLCNEIIESLASQKDALGDYLPPNELWGHLHGSLDDEGVTLIERGKGTEKYYESPEFSAPLTYEAFRKHIRRTREAK